MKKRYLYIWTLLLSCLMACSKQELPAPEKNPAFSGLELFENAESTLCISSDGTEEQAILFSAAMEWNASADAEWISLSADKGNGGLNEIILKASGNDRDRLRKADVTIVSGDEEIQIEVFQNGKNGFIQADKKYGIAAEGGRFQIPAASIPDVEIEILNSWISLETAAKGLDEAYSFVVAPCDGYERRGAVMFKYHDLSQMVMVVQAGKTRELYSSADEFNLPSEESYFQFEIEGLYGGDYNEWPDWVRIINYNANRDEYKTYYELYTLPNPGIDSRTGFLRFKDATSGLEKTVVVTQYGSESIEAYEQIVYAGSDSQVLEIPVYANLPFTVAIHPSCDWLERIAGDTQAKDASLVNVPEPGQSYVLRFNLSKNEGPTRGALVSLIHDGRTFCEVNIRQYGKDMAPGFSFHDYLLKEIPLADLDGNGTLDDSELQKITSLSLSFDTPSKVDGLTRLTGLENLEIIASPITYLDLSSNVKLKTLTISACNSLYSVKFSEEMNLQDLVVADCPNLELDLPSFPELVSISLETAIVSEHSRFTFPKLKTLLLRNIVLPELDFTNCPELKEISIISGDGPSHFGCTGLPELETVTMSALSELVAASFEDNPSLHSVSVDRCHSLRSVSMTGNPLLSSVSLEFAQNLNSFEMSGSTKLETFKMYRIGSKQSFSLDFSGYENLYDVDIDNSIISTLDCSGCPLLECVKFRNLLGQSLTGHALDVAGCPLLESLDCYDAGLKYLNLSDCTGLQTLDAMWNDLDEIWVWPGFKVTEEMHFNIDSGVRYVELPNIEVK